MKEIYSFLGEVEKPGRYIGNELNIIRKQPDENMIRYGFVFPDVYEIGMSHLGLHILHGALNELENVWCERAFAVGADMEEKMREKRLHEKENLELKLNTRKLKFNERRLLNAFPNVKLKRLSELKNPRDLLLKLDKIKK